MRKALLILLLASPVLAEGPKRRHQDRNIELEFQNVYQDLRNVRVTSNTLPSGSTQYIQNSQTSQSATFNVSSATITDLITSSINGSGVWGFRNRIINGDMRINQRFSATATTVTTSGYSLDRWLAEASGGGGFAISRSTVAPTGFTHSAFLNVTTNDSSVGASDYYLFQQRIEGGNVRDFLFGGSSAKSFTLSFWVRSSVTGTYSIGFANSAYNRTYVTTYAINSANTWEFKEIVIPGDTTGTWLTDTGIGLYVRFVVGLGSNFHGTANTWGTSAVIGTAAQTNWISTAGATFHLSGVQLEIANTASDFEYRPDAFEFVACQRYHQRFVSAASADILPGTGVWRSSTRLDATFPLPVTMRSTPTVATVGTVGNINVYYGGSAAAATGISSNGSTAYAGSLNVSIAAGATEGRGGYLQATAASAGFSLDSEL